MLQPVGCNSSAQCQVAFDFDTLQLIMSWISFSLDLGLHCNHIKYSATGQLQLCLNYNHNCNFLCD